MTDDDREGFEPEAAPDDAGDPAAAFEALRRTVEKQTGEIGAEMTIIRRGVEAAFDQFEKYRQPPDYGADLGRIIQFLAVVEERLAAVEQSPILRNGAEHYARSLERSGEGLVRTAALELERRATDLERAGRNLCAHVAGARERDRQNLWLVVTVVVGMIIGALVMLFLPRLLPFSAAPRVAIIVMGENIVEDSRCEPHGVRHPGSMAVHCLGRPAHCGEQGGGGRLLGGRAHGRRGSALQDLPRVSRSGLVVEADQPRVACVAQHDAQNPLLG